MTQTATPSPTVTPKRSRRGNWVRDILEVLLIALILYIVIWSALQTLGWNDARSTPLFRALSRVTALAVFVGFISVPVAVLAGWVR